MQLIRTAAPRFRLVLAGLVALFSVLQMPAMAFAWSGAATAHHGSHQKAPDVSHTQHEAMPRSLITRQMQHPLEHNHQDTSDTIQDVPACHVVGCCVGSILTVAGAPAANYLSLGLVDAVPARTMTPASLDPADPPPRFQV